MCFLAPCALSFIAVHSKLNVQCSMFDVHFYKQSKPCAIRLETTGSLSDKGFRRFYFLLFLIRCPPADISCPGVDR
ncbi:MAG: hypothetical protein JW997_06360 [Actinobacteria bacterium]|nr:hypothetical protein [Actinomycetota bacterium]